MNNKINKYYDQTFISYVQLVRLSLISCIIVVESLYYSSSRFSNSFIASSKAFFPTAQAYLISFNTS